jgi:hypothetical protein
MTPAIGSAHPVRRGILGLYGTEQCTCRASSEACGLRGNELRGNGPRGCTATGPLPRG